MGTSQATLPQHQQQGSATWQGLPCRSLLQAMYMLHTPVIVSLCVQAAIHVLAGKHFSNISWKFKLRVQVADMHHAIKKDALNDEQPASV